MLIGGGIGSLGRVAAQARLTQGDLLQFGSLGNVTLLHLTDLHGQLMPLHFREPSVNIGVGPNKGASPHLTGMAFLEAFKVQAGSAAA